MANDIDPWAPVGSPTDSSNVDPWAPANSKVEPTPISWSDVAKGAWGNLPSSAGELAKNIAHPFLHPIDTATGIKNVGLGALEKSGITSGTEHIPYADAIGEFYKNRFGGMENIKHTLAEDPVGAAADLATVLTGGGGMAARVPGLVGRVGEIAGTIGSAIDPIANAARVAKPVARVTGEGISHGLGLTTGAGAEAIKQAAESGYKGGQAAEDFQQNLRKTAPMPDVVQDAKDAVSELRRQRGENYRNSITGLKANQSIYGGIWADIANSITDASKIGTFKGKDLYPSTRNVRQKIFDDVSDWYREYRNDPGSFGTLESFDALKKKVGDIRDNTVFGTPERKVADTVYHAIRKAIVRADPEYGRVMEGYEKATQTIREIEDTLTLKPNARIDTSLRKLQSILRNNVNTNYGRRAELAQFLVDAGAPNLMKKLSGQTLSSWTPRGLQGAGLAGELGYLIMSHGLTPASIPGAVGAAAIASPRLVGEGAYYAGKSAKYAPSRNAIRALNQIGRLPLGDENKGFAKGGVVNRKEKIKRDAFLYMDSNNPHFAECSKCSLYKKGVCTILAMRVQPEWSCGAFLKGPYGGQEVKKITTPEEVGLVKHPVRCENCVYSAGNTCKLYEMLNKDMPDKFALDTKIKPHACCNAQTPIEDKNRADGGRVTSSHFQNANEALGLNQKEGDLYKRHLSNLWGPGGVTNPDGSRSTLYQAVVEHNGRYYNIPTVRDGKVLPIPHAEQAAHEEGIERFPSYSTPEEADARYDQMHGFMERDAEDYFNARGHAIGGRVGFADGGDPELSPEDQQLAATMTHQSEQPNTALPVINAVKDFYHGGLHDVLAGQGYQMPVWSDTISGFFKNPAVETALGMVGGMPTYSAAGAAARAAKAQSMQPSQWLGYLKNQPGVKAQELEHVGLEPWLNSKSGQVSKQEVDDFIHSQQPQITEVRKGQTDWEAIEKLDKERSSLLRENGRSDAVNDRIKEIEDQIDNLSKTPGYDRDDLKLPGGENYGETLLKLPESKPDLGDLPQRHDIAEKAVKDYAEQYGGNKVHSLYNPGPVGDEFRRLRYEQKAIWDEMEQRRIASLKNNYRNAHWPEDNVLLHVRHNDRTIPGGGKSLHLEELQSDIHQAGRKSGYKGKIPTDAEVKKFFDLRDTANPADYREEMMEHRDFKGNLVPNFPFKTTWSDLALKRMLHRAATEKNPDGSYKYDSLSWTPGQANADRYDLSKQVNRIYAHKNDDGTVDLFADVIGGRQNHPIKENVPLDNVHEYVGKDLSDKIRSQNERQKSYEGTDLKIGYHGMKSFYDKMLVDKANALTKKYGTRVQPKQISTGYRAMQAGPGDWRVVDPNNKGIGSFKTKEEAQKAALSNEPKVWHLPITPELRKAAEGGFPTFAYGGGVLGYEVGGDVEPLSDSDMAQSAAEAAAARVRAPYVRANDRISGLPQVLEHYGHKFVNTLTSPLRTLTGDLQVNDPETGMPTPESIQAGQSVANLAMTGGIPMSKPGSLGMAGGRLKHVEPEITPRAEEAGLRGRGELPGGEGQLETPRVANKEISPVHTETPLEGLPRRIKIPGHEDIEAGPHPVARQAARDYMEEAGLPYNPPSKYVKVDPENGKRIAQAFEEMKHDPDNPEVRGAYQAMADETMAQWKAIKKTGLKVNFIEGADPYHASPRLDIEDIKNNNHMWVYPTDTGFGEVGKGISKEAEAINPLLKQSGENFGGVPARINDIFRVVHDYFGHVKEGVGFRADGEENAWRSHAAMYSPEARRAMTSETRGQNSWVNWGPHGETNRTSDTPNTVFAEQKIGLLPDWVVNEGKHDPGVDTYHPAWIDTRLPTSKKVTSPGDKIVDLDSMKQSPKSYEKNVNLVRDYPNMPEDVANKASTDDMAEYFINHVKDNLLWLHDQIAPETRSRSKLWYEGARKIIDRWSKEFGLNDSAISGVLAALSPQMNWFKNVSLGKRLLDINTKYNNTVMSPQMETTFKGISSLQKNKPLFNLIKGKSLDDIDQMINLPVEERATLKAMWTRLYDEAHISKRYPIVTPEGYFGDQAKTKLGKPESIAWGSLPMIAKAIRSIEENGKRSSMNILMGGKHKIRNFYNNMLVPNSKKGDVTIDTHAVAAGLLRPLAGEDLEVSHNFKSYAGKGNPGASGSDITGVRGTYPLYAEAYRRAAAERGLLPREMQSITWEAIRGLFPEDLKGDKLTSVVDGLWNKYRTGKASLDETRQKILEAGGGIRDPEWIRSPTKLNEASRGSNNEGKLSESLVHGSSAQAPGPRVRSPSRAKVSSGQYYGKYESAGEREHLAAGEVDDAFDKAGLPLLTGDIRDKVVKLVSKKVIDPLDAYEQVIMEGYYGGEKTPKSSKKSTPPIEEPPPFAYGGRVDGMRYNYADGGDPNYDPTLDDAYQAQQAREVAAGRLRQQVQPEEGRENSGQLGEAMLDALAPGYSAQKAFRHGNYGEALSEIAPYAVPGAGSIIKALAPAARPLIRGAGAFLAGTGIGAGGAFLSGESEAGEELTPLQKTLIAKTPRDKRPELLKQFAAESAQRQAEQERVGREKEARAQADAEAKQKLQSEIESLPEEERAMYAGFNPEQRATYWAHKAEEKRRADEQALEDARAKEHESLPFLQRFPTIAKYLPAVASSAAAAIPYSIRLRQAAVANKYLREWENTATSAEHALRTGNMDEAAIHVNKLKQYNAEHQAVLNKINKGASPLALASSASIPFDLEFLTPNSIDALTLPPGNPAHDKAIEELTTPSEYASRAGSALVQGAVPALTSTKVPIPGRITPPTAASMGHVATFDQRASERAAEVAEQARLAANAAKNETRRQNMIAKAKAEALKSQAANPGWNTPAPKKTRKTKGTEEPGRAYGGRIMSHYIDHNPSAAQKKAGNYRKGHVNFHGLEIALENAKGSTRSGVDKNGKAWKSTLPAHYGYVKGSTGRDGDHIDVYLGPHHASKKIFVINQKDADTRRFQEHKAFIGFGSEPQVKSTFLKAFSDGKGKDRLGHITEMTIPEFKTFLEAESGENASS